MNILFIAGANTRLMPYMYNYIDLVDPKLHNLCVCYWDRDGLEDRELNSNIIVRKFTAIIRNDIPKIKKIKYFLRFKKYVKGVIENGNFDKIVVFDTQFAVLFSNILIRKYSGNYIVDYRDPSYEKFIIYKLRIAKLIKHCELFVISSDAYRSILPKSDKISNTHNLSLKEVSLRNKYLNDCSHNIIIIRFWGHIRDTEINIKIVKALANDSRFEVHYHGILERTAEEIESYCKTNRINNVFLNGIYLPDEKRSFIENTDIIHNMYNNINKKNPSMGNKFYDGIINYIPQICTKGSFMGDVVEKYNIGLSLDVDEHFGDRIFEYYKNIDWEIFKENCDKSLNIFIEEYITTQNLIESFLANK